MELTEIKGSLFGYSKKSVCQYISELNQIQGTELAAEKASAAQAALKYEEKIKELESEKADMSRKNEDLCDKIAALEMELSVLKESYSEIQTENASVKENYEALQKETRELREKSDVISTAIINAEKCATIMLSDADVRAKEMIDEAEGRVAHEVKRLDTAKTYYNGKAVVTSCSLEAGNNEIATCSITLTGAGEIQKNGAQIGA